MRADAEESVLRVEALLDELLDELLEQAAAVLGAGTDAGQVRSDEVRSGQKRLGQVRRANPLSQPPSENIRSSHFS